MCKQGERRTISVGMIESSRNQIQTKIFGSDYEQSRETNIQDQNWNHQVHS